MLDYKNVFDTYLFNEFILKVNCTY